jgi:hypothetical protein
LGSAVVAGDVEERRRLDECQRCGMEALCAEGRQVAGLLLCGALLGDREGEERRGDRRQRQRGVTPGELLEHDGVGEGRAVLAQPPLLLGKLRRGEPEAPGLLEQLVGHGLDLVALPRDGTERFLGELVHRVANELLLLGRLKRDHSCLLLVVGPRAGRGAGQLV